MGGSAQRKAKTVRFWGATGRWKPAHLATGAACGPAASTTTPPAIVPDRAVSTAATRAPVIERAVASSCR